MPEQNLQININVKGDAATKIKGVDEALKALNQKVGTLNSSNLPELSKNLHGLASALRELSGVNGANIYALGKQINHMLVTLGRLDVSKYSANIEKTTDEVAKMSQKFANFSGSAEKMSEGAHGLAKLPEIFNSLDKIKPDKLESLGQTMTTLANFTGKAAKNGSGIKSLAEGIEKLPSALNHFAKLPSDGYSGAISNLQSVIDQMQKLGVKGGSSLNSAAGGIKKLPEALREFGEASQYSEGIKQVAIALNMLAPALESVYKYGNGIKGVADGLDKLPRALRGFAETDNYTANISKLGETLGQLATTFNTFDKETTRMVEKGVGKNLREVEKDTTSGFKSLVSAISRLQKMGDENIDEKLARVAESIKKFVASLESITDEQAQKVYNLGVGLKSLVDASKGLDQAQENLAKLNSNKVLILRTAFRELWKELKKIPKRIAKATKMLAKFASIPMRPLLNGIKKVSDTIKRMFHSVARIGFYRLIRSGLRMITEGFKEGIDNLYKWAHLVGNDFEPTMDHLASEFLYLKNALGATVSPIIQALEPIITDLIHRFVELLNVFNQFVSMLSGQNTYRRAVYYAIKYNEDLEDSLDGAGKSAKELENILMDFDELNLITTPKDRSHSNDADDEDKYRWMFEEVPIDESLFDWLNGADWTTLGENFANKIASMLNGIDWDKIKKKTKTLSAKLSSFLNGVFGNKDLFKSLGSTLANAFNTSSLFTNDFFGNIDWEKLGNNFAEGLQTFLGNLNAYSLGKALTAWVSAIASVLHGFTEKMGDKEWKQLADTIYDVVSSAMQNIPWETAIPDLVELTTGLVNAIVAAIKGLKSAKDKIKKGLSDADWAGLASSIGDLITEMMPVIAVSLAISIVNIGVEIAKAVALKQILASAVAKAVGGTIVGGAGTGAGAGASGGGIDMSSFEISLGMDFVINAGIGVMIADIVFKWIKAGKLEEAGVGKTAFDEFSKELEEAKKSGYDPESRGFGYDEMLAYQLFGANDERWAEYADRIREDIAKWTGGRSIYTRKSGKPGGDPSAFFGRDADFYKDWAKDYDAVSKSGGVMEKYILEMVGRAEKGLESSFPEFASDWLPNYQKFLEEILELDDDYYAKKYGVYDKWVKRQAEKETAEKQGIISRISDAYAKGKIDGETYNRLLADFTNGNIDNINRALGAAESNHRQLVDSNKKQLDKLLADGKITEQQYQSIMVGLTSDTKDGVTNAINQINSLSTSAQATGKKYGTDFKTGLNSGVTDTGTRFASSLGKAIYNGKETLNNTGDKVQKLIAQGLLKPVGETGAKFTEKFEKATWNNRETLKNLGIKLGEKTGTGFTAGLGNKNGEATTSGKTLGEAALGGIKLGLGDLETQSETWGKHIVDGLVKGMNDNSTRAKDAAGGVAKDIKSMMAFSEPKEGPLSDFHTYMPDMIDLMVSGIKENQYRVENQMTSLASSMSGIANVATDPSLFKGDNGKTSGMADDIYNANAEERALLRELISAVKEQRLTISPSASLGKVVNQSQRLYAGVTG